MSGGASRTFRRRVTASMTLLAVGVAAVASGAIYWRVRQALRSNLDSALLSLARVEVASAVDDPSEPVHVHEEIPVLTAPTELRYERFAELKDQHGTIRAATANLAAGPPLETDPQREAQALRGQVSFADMRRGSEIYRGIYYPARDASGHPLVAVVAIPLRPLQRSLDYLLGTLVLALTIAGGAAALGARRLARRLTEPLERIAGAAGRIGGTTLQGRIPDVSPDVELRQVTHVLNEMLARLEATFSGQQRFLADASHELRSPVANLRGTIEVALRRRRTPLEYEETLTVALAEAERLSRLVDDLLTLSRVDANQFALAPVPCDLADIVQAAVAAADARLHGTGVQIRLEITPTPIVGDAHRLRQVVDNLLDNAVRYAPAGSDVVVRSRHEHGQVVLCVQDKGPGLSPGEQARVFDRLYRTDAARSRDSGGLGLGLPIAKAIVEAHQGTIEVRSTPGDGCTFTVHLPAAQPAHPGPH